MTVLLKAALTGRAKGDLLESYHETPVAGDVEATFVYRDYKNGGTGNFATQAEKKTIGYGARGFGPTAYAAGATPTTDTLNLSMSLAIRNPLTGGYDQKGFMVGDDGASNYGRLFAYQDPDNVWKLMIEVIAGASATNTYTAGTIPTPGVGSTHALGARLRGSGATRTIQMTWDGADVGTAITVPGITVIGRRIGISNFFFVNASTTETDDIGAKITAIEANDQAGSAGLAKPGITAAAGPTAGTATVTATASEGAAPYTYAFSRAVVTNGEVGNYAAVGSASNTRTLNATGLTPGATYAYRVTVTDATNATATSDATMVTIPVTGFTIATNPASVSLAQGESLTVTVTLAAQGGYSGTDTLVASGLPAGVSASFAPPTIANGSGVSTLTLTAAGNAVTGFGEIAIGSATHAVGMQLQVNPPSGIVYPAVASVLGTDLVTITRAGTTQQATAAALKAFLAA
jgi:hypothetical protein